MNLAILLLLLLAASWLGWRRDPPHQWEASWHDEFRFDIPHQSWSFREWLEVEKDRYRRLVSSCSGSGVVERGRVTLDGEKLLLHSDKGGTSGYRLWRKDGLWMLGSHQQTVFKAPRCHPRADWYQPDKALTIEGVSLGMSRQDVLRLYPVHMDEGGGHFSCLLPDYRRKFNVVVGKDGAKLITGDSLEQAGRVLLNRRSNRSDVNAIWGHLDWKEEQSKSSRCANAYVARVAQVGLSVRVIARIGELEGEHSVVSLSLSL